MLKEDYIMRLFQQFNEMLAKWLNKKRFDNVELAVNFNDEVVKPFLDKGIEFFEKKGIQDVINYFSDTYANQFEKMSRLEILAESLYQKSLMISESDQHTEIRRLALDIFTWLNEHDSTFSLTRDQRIEELNIACERI